MWKIWRLKGLKDIYHKSSWQEHNHEIGFGFGLDMNIYLLAPNLPCLWLHNPWQWPPPLKAAASSSLLKLVGSKCTRCMRCMRWTRCTRCTRCMRCTRWLPPSESYSIIILLKALKCTHHRIACSIEVYPSSSSLLNAVASKCTKCSSCFACFACTLYFVFCIFAQNIEVHVVQFLFCYCCLPFSPPALSSYYILQLLVYNMIMLWTKSCKMSGI